MASIKEDKIDFEKLERKMTAAVDADKLYWLKNDAKFRAINQKVGSYDEFKEIVNAAHLRPLNKTDKIDMDKNIDHPWNTVAGGSTGRKSTAGSAARPSSSTVRIPRNSNEFALEWRKRSVRTRGQYIESIGCEKMLQIFKLEISFGLLGELIQTLQENRELLPASFTIELLKGLTDCGRFQLSLSFLSDKEKQALQDMLSTLTDIETVDRTVVENLQSLYGL